jgi:hypothetical protein
MFGAKLSPNPNACQGLSVGGTWYLIDNQNINASGFIKD